MKCKVCGKELKNDDIGATKKLINRGETEYLCITCLAKRFNVTEEMINQKIDAWRRMGCALFAGNDTLNRPE